MVKNLHLGILVEGVEAHEQMHFQNTIDCHDIQGFLFGGPIPAERFGASVGDLDVFKLTEFERPSGNAGTGNPAIA